MELFEFREKGILKSSFSSGQKIVQIKSNSVGVPPVQLECNTKRVFSIACLGKKLAFHTEIC